MRVFGSEIFRVKSKLLTPSRQNMFAPQEDYSHHEDGFESIYERPCSLFDTALLLRFLHDLLVAPRHIGGDVQLPSDLRNHEVEVASSARRRIAAIALHR